MELAGLVVAGVSALGTLVQAYFSAKSSDKPVSKQELNKAKERAKKPLKVGAKQVSLVIDSHLLRSLNAEIERHNSALVKAFTDPNLSALEKEQHVQAAQQQICHFLTQIKKFNKNKLPTRRLQKLWLSNQCQTLCHSQREIEETS